MLTLSPSTHEMWSGQYLDNDWIIPLDDMIKSDKEISSTISFRRPLAQHLARQVRDAAGRGGYAQGTIYRTDVFKELGLMPPDQIAAKDWTWDKYLETVKAIQGKEVGGKKLFGTVICGSQPVPIVHMFTQVAASFGGRWFEKFPEAPWDSNPRSHRTPWSRRPSSTRSCTICRRPNRSTTSGTMPGRGSRRAISVCSTGGPRISTWSRTPAT